MTNNSIHAEGSTSSAAAAATSTSCSSSSAPSQNAVVATEVVATASQQQQAAPTVAAIVAASRSTEKAKAASPVNGKFIGVFGKWSTLPRLIGKSYRRWRAVPALVFHGRLLHSPLK